MCQDTREDNLHIAKKVYKKLWDEIDEISSKFDAQIQLNMRTIEVNGKQFSE